jgi:RimJ/RimL family protein N-acetyltransferase
VVKAPERLETRRLVLRRPRMDDAEWIFARYASDREVTRYVSWPVHASVDETRAFLAFCDSERERWPAGPYLVHSREGDWTACSTVRPIAFCCTSPRTRLSPTRNAG